MRPNLIISNPKGRAQNEGPKRNPPPMSMNQCRVKSVTRKL